MCDLQGKNHKKIYTVKNIENNLSIERYPDGQLLLIEDHSQEKTYFEIKYDGTLEQLANVRVPPKDWILPILRDYAVIFLWKSQGLMITQTHGEKTLWKCSSSQKPIQLLRIPAGVIKIDPFAAWENRSIFQMIVSHPSEGTIPYIYHPESGPILQYPKVPTTLVGRRIQSFSFDNVTVHGYVAHSRYEAPRKLLVIGYGAYGLPTGVGSFKQRWAPLLENGWAVAVAFVRGGGDHTDAWGYAGRRGDRENTFQDFLAIIRKCQYMFKIAPKHTAIYGRSAGGLLMGGALGKHPDGGLMGAIYTEVPYVDVLRTTTNDELPLTVLEYDEFGNPRMRLEDFLDVGLMSPADSATLLKTPNVFVLARTAVHDSQVFAYEPLKWIRRLREHAPKGAPKLCVVNRHAGHFTAPDIQYDQWSLDCAMLDAWVSGEYDDLP
jgi:hypothetical protein